MSNSGISYINAYNLKGDGAYGTLVADISNSNLSIPLDDIFFAQLKSICWDLMDRHKKEMAQELETMQRPLLVDRSSKSVIDY